jgi:hypothetical protein
MDGCDLHSHSQRTRLLLQQAWCFRRSCRRIAMEALAELSSILAFDRWRDICRTCQTQRQ